MENVNAETIHKFSELKQGDHLVAIDQNKCLHGIFIGFVDGVVKFGTDEVDGTSGPEKVDLLKFANDAQEKLVRITYEQETCIDPSKTLSHALNRDLFDFSKSGAQHAFKCKTGQSASEHALHAIRRSTDKIMESHFQKVIQQLTKFKDRALWSFK